MPVARVRPTNWEPDLGDIRTNTIPVVSGVTPYSNGWIASPQYLGSVKTYPAGYAPGEIGGLYIHQDAATLSNAYMYLGTNDDIYRTNVANVGDLTDATGAATFSAYSAESGWQFASFGNNVLATNGVDPIQIATTPTTNFVASNQTTVPASYDPKCKYITVVRNHVLIGNISFAAAPSAAIPKSALTGTSYPTMVMWSATDNARRFGDPIATPDYLLVGSDWQDFPDEHGPVTGLIGGESALIFKRSAIYRMDGPPWTFTNIVSGCGTIYPNSIVKAYEDVYFWGPGGPTVLRSGSTTPELISSGRCKRFLIDSLYGDDYVTVAWNTNLCGAYDSSNDLIIWSFGTGSTLGAFLVYNIKEDRFGYFKFIKSGASATVQAIASAPAGLSFNIGGSIYARPGSTFSNIYGIYDLDGVDTSLFGMIGSTTPVVTVAGAEDWDWPRFEFPYLTFPIGANDEAEAIPASSIIAVRPVYSAGTTLPLDVNVTVRTCSRFPMEYSEKSGSYAKAGAYQQDNGWILIDSETGTHHKITIEFKEPAGAATRRTLSSIRSFFELEIEYMTAGKSGSGYRA